MPSTQLRRLSDQEDDSTPSPLDSLLNSPASELSNQDYGASACLPPITGPGPGHGHGPDLLLRSASVPLKLQIAAATFSFFMVGFIPSAIGVIIPHLEEYYSVGDTVISLIFICSPLGYIAAAFTNSFIHVKYGQRGIALIASITTLIFTFCASLHPPFPLLLLVAVLYYYGAGLLDASWSAWAGSMENVNTVQGVLHSGLSVGASLGPILAGTVIEVGQKPWYSWYYVLTALSVVEAVFLLWAFRFNDGKAYMSHYTQSVYSDGTWEAGRWAPLRHAVTWICGAYFLSYVGSEASINGWIVTFMRRVRHAEPYLASLSTCFFWSGITLGRLTLGYATDRIGVRLATALYIVAAILLQAAFAFITGPVASTVSILLIGYFFGPLFPSGLVMLVQSLDRALHVRAVAIAVTFGQIGGALIPSALGALSELIGMKVFQVVIFAWLIITLLLWISFPKIAPQETRASGEQRQSESGHNANSDEVVPFMRSTDFEEAG
ncbi:major facilitator superfamily domain-containing protein [Xylariaceae sp. FL0016]|nr:major facilitator superfamily domain-containing protein [Xylariaceae sp. FL0016]